MDRPADSTLMYLAPGAAGYASIVLPGARHPDLPPVDEYVVEPETRTEMIDGRIVYVSPASPPHGDLHTRLDSIVYNHTAPGYVVSTDMLTRTSERWNFAADASIRKSGTDPATGHRYLEELAFEVKHKQTMTDLTARACQLAGRGVRRVFVICVRSRKENGEDILVQTGPVLEWMPGEDRWTQGRWQKLDENAVIEDVCLHSPIRVRALLDAAEADDAVARALHARGNPVLRAMSLRETITSLCEVLAIELTPARRARIETLDAEALRILCDFIKSHRRWDQ